MNDVNPTPNVDGVEVPVGPPAAVAAGAPPATPQGAPGAPGGDPDRTLLKALEDRYNATGQSKTGKTYLGPARRFFTWMEAKGMTFRTMPADAMNTFLEETIPNPVTRNVCGVALRAVADIAATKGITFTPQQIKRAATPRKKQPQPQPLGVPMATPPQPSSPESVPFVEYMQRTMPVEIAPRGAPAVAAQPHYTPPPAPQPQQVQQHHAPQAAQDTAFRSLGRRVRISKLSGSNDYGVAPGQPFVIGTYDKYQIEAEGSLENFIMFRLRPSVGPKPGEPPVVYRAENLDTSGRPLQGQFWDVPICADPLAPGGSSAQAPAPVVVNAAQAGAGMEKMLDMAFRQQKDAQDRYDALQRQLLEKRDAGKLDDTTLMLLLERNKPAPLDADALKRMIRDEMAASAPPPTPAAPQMPLGGFGGMFGGGGGMFEPPAPRADPALERLSALVEKQTEMMNQLVMRQLTQPPPAQKDPMEMAMTMLATINGIASKSDPVKDELAKMSIQQLSNPPKSKTLAETLADLQAIQKFTHREEPPSSMSDRFFDTVQLALENSDKLGDAIGRARAAALKAAMQQPAPAPKALPATPPKREISQADYEMEAARLGWIPEKPQPQPQPITVPNGVREAMFGLEKVLETNDTSAERDFDYVQGVLAVIQQLDAGGAPWKGVADATIQQFKAARNYTEVIGTLTTLLRRIGYKMAKATYTEHLARVFHRNYSQIFAVLNDGQVKVLEDAAPVPAETDTTEAEDDEVEEEDAPATPDDEAAA